MNVIQRLGNWVDDYLELPAATTAPAQVRSPITRGKAKLLRRFSGADIRELYLRTLAFDVGPYLRKDAALELWECADTGYQFYTPFDAVEGPPEFYSKLYSAKGNEWGYAEGKWEHRVALNYCTPSSRVLDIGCGGGAFLDLARKHSREVVGLETSAFGLESCRNLGLTVYPESIDKHRGSYDVVCSFQVLEHAANVRQFLEGCIAVTKPGGTIVVSVPNNEGFVGAQDLPLNMPPHHVGRWGPKSLEAITRHFPLELRGIYFEPLGHNVDWYRSWLERTYFAKSRLARFLWNKLGFSKALSVYLKDHAHTIHGHTVMAVYGVRDDLSSTINGESDTIRQSLGS